MDVFSLVPQFGGFAFTIVTFVVALSVIVAVHEYGHYIVGRWSGIHPEVFSLGFGPVLWSRVDRRGTKWQIAALPFGGYVKFMGDADAASGKDGATMKAAAADPAVLRKTMHGAPLWARSATVAAGPVFNFIMSIIVFSGLIMWQGQPRVPLTVEELPAYIQETTGLRPGDEILSIAGTPLPGADETDSWSEFQEMLPLEPVLPYIVRRNGAEVEVQGPYLIPSRVSHVIPRSAADDIGMEPGDLITSVDGVPIFAFEQLKEAVEAAEGRVLLLEIKRGTETLEMALAPRRMDQPAEGGGFETRWLIGIGGGEAFSTASDPVPFGQAFVLGAGRVWSVIEGTFSGISHMISGEISTCNLSGPVGIAQTSSSLASQGLIDYIGLIAVLSTAIGLLNLFPVPVLDGGHLVFYAYEAVTGKPPSDRIMQALMTLGITIVLALMVFSIANDFLC